MRVARPKDSVERLLEYKQAHPQITFTAPNRESALWKALDDDGNLVADCFDLDLLLDKLESLPA
jgi:hypothetical protein